MKLNLKTFLIGITVIAVVSDSMLIPFYPQFFAAVFNVTDPQYVGNYIAATCLVVMLAFPCWARVAKTIPPLHLLIYTQLAAGILSVMCFWTTSLWAFWTVSLAMLAFKGSYLLVYPFVMSLEDSSRHGGTIGLLSVIVHFGAILGALLGGIVLQLLEPRQAFLIMAVGDFLQTLVCILLVRQERSENPQPAGAGDPQLSGGETVSHGNRRFIVKLSLVMLVFYFCAYLIRPFFSVYWESISAFKGEIAGRHTGVLISNGDGEAVAYALWNLEDRGPIMIDPGTKVYRGMIVGEHSRDNDLEVNVLKGKQLTNIRSAGKDEAVKLTPPIRMTLDRALSWIQDDELVEVTPKSIRLRKLHLDPHERKRSEKAKVA